MDAYDRKLPEFSDGSGRDRARVITPLKTLCNCPQCPTHTECAKKAMETLFCVTGRSFICMSEDRGCLCPVCPVASQLGLTRDFFCLRGSEAEQRYLRLQKNQDIKQDPG